MPRFNTPSVDHAGLSGVNLDNHHQPLMPHTEDTGSTQIGVPGWSYVSVGVRTQLINERYYIPIYVERTKTFTRIGAHNLTSFASTLSRLGIYAADFNSDGELVPGALELDAGTIDVSTTGEKLITIDHELAPGFHFLTIGTGTGLNFVSPDPDRAVTVPVTSNNTVINGGGQAVLSIGVADAEVALPDPATAPDTPKPLSDATVMLGW